MPRLLLHIGHPKTGTTALQSVFSANAKTLLSEASALYPTQTEPQEYKHSFAIPWLFRSDNDAIRRRSRLSGEELQAMSKRYWQSLCTEIQQTRHDISIISAEGFWSIARPADHEQKTFARNALYEIAGEITVVAYLKSPISYFLSKINQKLRNFKPVTLPRADYISGAINAWESMGFDHYSWRIFDRKLLSNQDIIDDFCTHHFPGSLSGATLKRDGIEQANSSVSNEALVILEDLTSTHTILRKDIYEPRRHRIVEIIKQADQAVGGMTRPSLKASATNAILSRSRDLHWLEQRGLFFPDIDKKEVSQEEHDEIPSTFTCVSDFCPVDADRLAALRSHIERDIEALFRPASKLFFWPSARRN